MKRTILTATALLISATFTGSVEAKAKNTGNSGHSGQSPRIVVQSTQIVAQTPRIVVQTPRIVIQKNVVQTTIHKNITVNRNSCWWTRSCWFPQQRCWGYYYPTDGCWYYCDPMGRYLPLNGQAP